jgi:putative aminopeptidase
MRVRMAAFLSAFAVLLLLAISGAGQANLNSPKTRYVAVTAHESNLGKQLVQTLHDLSPQMDNMGNVYVSIGTGSPHRLIATAIDEPGYIVSEITPDGYLRVQRLPQAPPNAVFDSLSFAQPVLVTTRTGKQVPGVFAGLSVHLQPGRPNPPKMDHVEELYVDIGAKTAADVRSAGVDLLDPVAPRQSTMDIGDSGRAGPGTAVQLSVEALLELLPHIKESKAPGTTTIAFVTQQFLGGRGLDRLLTEIHPDEMIFVGPVAPAAKDAKVEGALPGSGILLGVPANASATPDSLPAQLKALADKDQIPLHVLTAAPPRLAAYTKGASFPDRFAQLGFPLLWPVTAAQTAARPDVNQLRHLLHAYLEISAPTGEPAARASSTSASVSVIQALTEAYGASGHESAVREAVKTLLPDWARNKITTDSAGNLILHLGDAKPGVKAPRIAFVAHMDEIGYEVKKIDDDGRLEVAVLGGGYLQFFLGHVALVHKKDGTTLGAVMELPSAWDKPNFEWPTSFRSMDEPARVYVGTASKSDTEKLGIQPGDYITIPKQYVPLLGTRANARSFDDRVGDAALIAAVRALGPTLPARDVTFVWSTEEEVGLKGAAAFAEQADKEGRAPDFVFAIDTFVSSDSPLESKRFADAELGKGFVVRAVDNSNVVPLQYVDRVVSLARQNNIPVQYGVTGGGNDGSVFPRFGTVDVALGWPLRYAHSPAEVIDTKDLDALGKIVEVLARKW